MENATLSVGRSVGRSFACCARSRFRRERSEITRRWRRVIRRFLPMRRYINGFSESYLVAKQTEIAVSLRNDPVLSCHILPRMLDRTVHYCRWIRPDGYGIYNDISHRYTANSSYSQCRLVILSKYDGHEPRYVRTNVTKSA